MNFVALDVETANADLASICQIGIVRFENGKVIDTWSSLVNPKDYFDPMNISIHGICEEDVRHAPDFKQVSSEILRRINGQVVAIHTAFDRSAIARASIRNGAEHPNCNWLDTASVARRTWPEVAQRGYGLKPIAQKLGIAFEHHDAAEDARAAGLILIQAMAETNLDLAGWLERVKHPIGPDIGIGIARAGNPEGPLYGEVIAFTGALAIPRREAVAMAVKVGCETIDTVNKRLTLLVVGDQDIGVLNGHEKSSKHRKAEELIAKGLPIRILTETDFAAIVSLE